MLARSSNRSIRRERETVQLRRLEVAVFVVRRRRTEVLVARRVQGLGGHWHVIAGGVDHSEAWEAAVVRELAEETGLHCEDVHACVRTSFTYALEPSHQTGPDGVVRARHVGVECILLEVPDDCEPRLNWEHEAYRWCSVEQASALLRWSNIRDALHELLALAEARSA